MTMKWGVISTANIALTQFIPALNRANRQLVAIASRGPRVHDVAQTINVEQAYESYEALLQDEKVEAVYIPLPNDLHVEWIEKAAQAGKHVLCEKPMTLTREQFQHVQHSGQKYGVVVMEAFMYQFHPQYDTVKQLLQQGIIGDVKLYQSSHSFLLEDRATNIRMDKTKGGGALWDVGCYSLHALQQLLNVPVETVYADAVLDEASGVDVTTTLQLQLQGGVRAMIDCSFDMVGRNCITIVGTKGTIHIRNAFRPDEVGHIGEIVIETPQEKRQLYVTGDIYRSEIEFFEQVVQGQASIQQQHALSKHNVELITAAYHSAATKEVVQMKQWVPYD